MNPERLSAASHEVAIPTGGAMLAGDLVVPERGHGIVLFAHGSGSSRKSPRNVFVAEQLQRHGMATLLFDLLTREEERIDLAEDPTLARVAASTLLIVGSLDERVLELNRHAYAQLTCGKDRVVIPGATHLFEEPGTLEQVARLAATWFDRHVGKGA